jgi:outer membrane receptor protein involved in Fe transport
MVGARMEHSAQQVSTFELFNPSQVPVGANLATTDVLPSTTVTIGVGAQDAPDEMLVRLSYGRTLSRPEFRELSEVPFTDFRTGVLFYGNPDLQRALIDNFDLRWEWYPRAGESLSVAAFGKLFRNPIEQVTEVSAVSGLSSTFANARRATNIGVEADFRFYFDHLHKALSDLYMSGNAAFIYSRIDVGDSGNDTSEKRPLQGQSPWVVNAAIGYDSPTTGISVSLLYNVFGPRIVDVGQSGVPDTYELPVHRLDLVGLFPTGKGWQIRVRGSNLLDWPVRQRTGTEIAEEQRDGWGASIGIQYAAPPKADEDKERATPPAPDGQR